MSPAHSKTDYKILAVLALASAVLLLVIVGYGVVSESDDVRQRFRTSRSRNVQGVLVYYTLLDRMGLSARRSEVPLLTGNLAEWDVVLMLDPFMPLNTDESAALEQWVRSGGVAVCAGHPAAVLGGFEVGGVACETCTISPDGEEGRVPTTVPMSGAGLPLARDAAHLSFASTTTFPDPGAGGGAESVRPLLADSRGLRVAERPMGRGCVIAISDTSFLANGWIGRADNAVAAVNLAAYALAKADGNALAFDEYHFGFGTHETAGGVLTHLVLRTSPGWAILTLTFAGLLFLFYKGRRFGTRRPLPARVRRRSKLEFVRSVGTTYKAMRAHRLTLRLIVNWFMRSAAARVGLPARATSAELAHALARRVGKPGGGYLRTLQACEAAAAGEALSERRMARLLSELRTIETEAFNGPARSE